MLETVYIGFGSNLGDSMSLLESVTNEINACEGISFKRSSPVYESAPIGVTDKQNDYINAVFEVESTLQPAAILNELLRLEDIFGRVRGELKNAARTLDLDLLLVGDKCINSENLTLPHPRIHQRAFVLYPLADLSPELHIPGHGKLAQLLKDVSTQKIKRL